MTVNGKRADAEQVQREMDRLDRLVAVQAAEIERLLAEVGRLTNGRDTMGNLWAKEKEDNERLRAALRLIDSVSVHSGGDVHGVNPKHWEAAFKEVQAVARAALEDRT